MTSPHLLNLPGEIRNNIYRQLLCYDGIKLEIRPNWSPWEPWNSRVGPCNHLRHHHSCLNCLRMQLDVIAPVRRGNYAGVLPVFASHILNILRTCRQIHEEAHAIFWTENAFVFSGLPTMAKFVERIGDKPFRLIRTLGIENRVDIDWMNRRGRAILENFRSERVPPFLQQPHRPHEWEIKVDQYDCLRDHWFTDCGSRGEIKLTSCKIPCKTIYVWMTRLSTSEVRLTTDSADATDGSHGLCTVKSLPIRH